MNIEDKRKETAKRRIPPETVGQYIDRKGYENAVVMHETCNMDKWEVCVLLGFWPE
jgi:hypothetical protein